MSLSYSGEKCGFIGNSDLYGTGIRVGYYTQAFAIWFATFFVSQEGKALRPVNTLFMLAMVIGLFVLSFDSRQTHAAEAFLLLQIIITTWFIGTLDITGYSVQHWQSSIVQVLIRETLTMVVLVYNFWFWWFGLDKMKTTPCGTFVFFVVAKVELYGFFRRMHKVLSILALVHDVLKKGYFTTTILHRLSNRRTDSDQFVEDLAKSLRNESDIAKTEHNEAEKLPKPERAQNHVHDVEVSPSSPILERKSIDLSPDPDLKTECHTATSISQSSGSTLVASETLSTACLQKSNQPHSEPSAASETSQADLPSFVDLYDADRYLDDIVGSYDQRQTRRWQLNLFQNKVRIFVPNLRHFTDSLGAVTREVHGIIFQRRKINISVTISSLTYILSIRGYAYDAYLPFLIAILKHSSHLTRPRRPLHIMKRIRLSRLPRKAPKNAWVPWAITTLIICVGQVLAVELVVRWNHVTGLQSFGTVGQLIPFVLGIGGLGKVLWTKSILIWEGRSEKRRDALDEGGVDDLADAYFARKERYETHAEIVDDSAATLVAQDA